MKQEVNIGKLIKQTEGYKTFIPEKFPPKNLDFLHDAEIIDLLSRASLEVGNLNGLTRLLPDVDFFIFMYVKKEAAYSSQIEGTRAKLSDAIQAEIEKRPDLPDDVDDILHYVKAMNLGLQKLENIPLSLRLIKEVHKALMQGARQTHEARPGEFRADQNWINGTSPHDAEFVPPPPAKVLSAMGELESLMHKHSNIPPLVKAGLLHAQFETIHPFRDGNGRVGRLLITFFLCQQNVLDRPTLYISEFLKKHRKTYFLKLNAYHDGGVNEWLKFFLKGVIEVSRAAVQTSSKIVDLREHDMQVIASLGKKTSVGAIELIRELYKVPIVDAARVQQITGFSRQGSYNLINKLVEEGILEQRGEKEYGKSYIHKRYFNLFD